MLLRNWRTSHSLLKSCEEGNYPSQKPHTRIKKHRLEAQQRLLFVPLSVALCPAAFHTGFLLHSTSFSIRTTLFLTQSELTLRDTWWTTCVWAHSGCRRLWWPPRIWVTAKAELTYSPSCCCAWHTVISVIDICPGWRRRVTRGRDVTSRLDRGYDPTAALT